MCIPFSTGSGVVYWILCNTSSILTGGTVISILAFVGELQPPSSQTDLTERLRQSHLMPDATVESILLLCLQHWHCQWIHCYSWSGRMRCSGTTECGGPPCVSYGYLPLLAWLYHSHLTLLRFIWAGSAQWERCIGLWLPAQLPSSSSTQWSSSLSHERFCLRAKKWGARAGMSYSQKAQEECRKCSYLRVSYTICKSPIPWKVLLRLTCIDPALPWLWVSLPWWQRSHPSTQSIKLSRWLVPLRSRTSWHAKFLGFYDKGFCTKTPESVRWIERHHHFLWIDYPRRKMLRF